jgi:hypothetical protein
MILFIGTSLIYIFFLTNRLKFVDSTKTSPIRIRIAATSLDFFDVNVHKHQALLSAYSSVPDYYRRNIERMMLDPELKIFMAFKGDILVGCADLLSIDVGNHYHIQNVIVASDHRRYEKTIIDTIICRHTLFDWKKLIIKFIKSTDAVWLALFFEKLLTMSP